MQELLERLEERDLQVRLALQEQQVMLERRVLLGR